jgi:hypothetical protein
MCGDPVGLASEAALHEWRFGSLLRVFYFSRFTYHLSPSSLCVFAALREIFSLFPEAGGAAVDQEHG